MAGPRRTAPIVVAAVLLVVVAACPLFVLSQPSSYRISRSRLIGAPPDRVRAELDDVRRLAAWDPRLGPRGAPSGATATFSPVTTGPGAWVEWRSPGATVRSTITSLTLMRIELLNAVDGNTTSGTSRTVFTLARAARGTVVTWSAEGDNDLLRRILWPFANLEARLTPDLDAALLRLDSAARAP